MRFFGRRKEPDTGKLGDALMDQFQREQIRALNARYDWLVGSLAALVAPGRKRVTRAEIRDLLTQSGYMVAIIDLPENISPMQVDEIRRRIGEDSTYPTVVS